MGCEQTVERRPGVGAGGDKRHLLGTQRQDRGPPHKVSLNEMGVHTDGIKMDLNCN